MTAVRLDFTVPQIDGVPIPTLSGYWLFAPSKLLIDDETAQALLPDPFVAELDEGVVVVDFEPSGADWCWVGKPLGMVGIIDDRYFSVPDSVVELAFYGPEVQDVDPTTLDPTTPVIPAYLALIEAARALAIAAQADLDEHEADQSNPHAVTAAQVGLGLANDTPDADKPVSGPQQIALDGKATSAQGAKADTAVQPGSLAPVATSGSAADLTSGTLDPARLPALAITSVTVVASQAAMLALDAQQGDVAIRSDFTPNKAFMLASNSPTTLADWKDITATDLVQSVAGLNGNITAAGLVAAIDAELAASLSDSGTAAGAAVAAEIALGVGVETAAREAANDGLMADLPATFGEIMRPYSKTLLSPAVATVANRSAAPTWWDGVTQTRWDEAGAFTFSGTPSAYAAGLPQFGCQILMGTTSPKAQDITFTVSDSKCAPQFLSFGVQDYMVWVNGFPASFDLIPTVDGFNWLDIQFPKNTSAQIRVVGCFVFVGVMHTAAGTVRATPPRHTVGVVADSYWEVNTSSWSHSMGIDFATATGFRVWNMCQGGTGYVNDGGGVAGSTKFGSPQRLALLAAAPIDSLLVWGTGNDGPPYDALFPGAAEDYYDHVAATKPGCPIIVAGVEPVSGFRSSIGAALNDSIEVAAAARDNVVGFVNAYDEQWLTGTGNLSAPNGTGNQDWNITNVDGGGIHPGPDGSEYLAGRMLAPAISSFKTRVAA